MSKKSKPLKISEEAAVQMPMKTVASLIGLVAIGTWAFFGIQEKLNKHNTQLELMERDLEMNTEYKQVDKMQIRVDSMMHNEVNIEALAKAVDKLQRDVEKLKDKQREFANGNGEH